MNRRGFLSSLSLAIVGTGVAYSFPDIIVPKNIISLEEIYGDGIIQGQLSAINIVTLKEIYPKIIEDLWFTELPHTKAFRMKYFGDYARFEVLQ